MLDRYDQDLLLDYLEGELDQDRRAQLDAMLAADPQLAALLHQMSLDRAALRSIPEAQAPADLVHDVTCTLERRMLLDEPVDETGPIPITRGRGLDPEPVRSIRWGRVVGLTGLAASVALAAGIVVITLDDPLERTANELAANPPAKTDGPVEETAAPPGGDRIDQPAFGESIAQEAHDTETQPNRIASLLGDLDKRDTNQLAIGIDREAWDDAPKPKPADAPQPATATATAIELDLIDSPVVDAPTANLAPGSTAAISVIQPTQQLVLLTESPEASREQLFKLCVANGIPIVQTDKQDPDKRPSQGLRSLNNDSTTAAPDIASPDKLGTKAPISYDDYALLINESQLDMLVRNLNNNVTIDPARAGKASLIAKQAAVLALLPQEGKDPDDGQKHAAQTNQPDPNDPLPNTLEEHVNTIEPQAIQLQLPKDLGSEYANTLNAYNLQRSQQQTGYAKQETTNKTQTQAPTTTAMTEGVTSLTAEPALAADAHSPKAEQALPSRRESAPNKPTRPATPIDPARGNWLSAHLPIVNTTPLILQWRADQSDKPTTLITILIKRAAPDNVNALRKRQQAEPDSRTKEAQPTDATEGVDPAEQADLKPATTPTSPADQAAE